MRCLVTNPYFQLLFGATIGFAGSVVANLLFFGRIEKKRATREAQRAYNKLVNRLTQTTISDLNHPVTLLPLEISERIEDLKFALEDVNREFEYQPLVRKAIEQAAELRSKQASRSP